MACPRWALLKDARKDQRHVDVVAVRGDDAAGHPVEVEEVRQQAVELAGVGRDPSDEVVLVLAGDLLLTEAPLERQGAAEDARERRPEVVRHGLEERVLHLVERAQPGGRLLLGVERLHQLGLGVLLLGDVVHHALQVDRLPGLVRERLGLFVDPDDVAVLADDPVLAVHPGLAVQQPQLGVERALPVLGDDALAPQVGLTRPLVRA